MPLSLFLSCYFPYIFYFYFWEEPLHLLNNTLRRNIVYWTTTHFLDSERATDSYITWFTSFLLDAFIDSVALLSYWYAFIDSVALLSYWMPYTVTHSLADLCTTKETRKQSIKCYPLKTNENRAKRSLKVRIKWQKEKSRNILLFA